MGKTLFGIGIAALIMAFVAGWAIPQNKARVAGATGQVDTFENVDDWETNAFRALRRLFLRVQLRVPLSSGRDILRTQRWG